MARKEKMANTAQEVPAYHEMLEVALDSKVPFCVGGTFALSAHTGINRDTKDLDLFIRPSDYHKLLEEFKKAGFKVSVPDERWLAKAVHEGYTIDLIFSLANAIVPINDLWFEHLESTKLFDLKVPLLSPTELLWANVLVQDRFKNVMADLMHLILRAHERIDWHRLLSHMEQYWEMLLIVLLYFRFVYPSEREIVPRWLLDELLGRLEHQKNLPTLAKKICRGRLLTRSEYEVDIKEWGFEDFTA